MKSKAHLKSKHDLTKKRNWLLCGHNIALLAKASAPFVRVFIYISKCQDMCFVEDIKVKGQLLVHTKFSLQPPLPHAATTCRRRAGKGAPKTLIFAIYFKPKCEELLLDFTAW